MSEAKPPDHATLLKRALIAIDQLEDELAAAKGARDEPIAVVGIGCRFPGGVDGADSLWKVLVEGVDTVTEVPPERWDIERIFDPDPDAVGKTYTRWGAFLDGVDQFDAQFFGISPREAAGMDPQQRILLEVTWQALEHAGIAPTSLAGGDAAVYVGISTSDYWVRLAQSGRMAEADAYATSGTAHSIAGGRISYALGLHGPNISIDTACSSSLVALHHAVQALRSGETALALAGGVNLTLLPDGSILTARGRMMSFTGRCSTFDASADGYVRGEGCAMLALKRLADATRDGDRVLGVIRGTALNQDGRTSGMTAPNGRAQVAVIRAALANARVKPSDIGYIEAHGTGTSLGDPIEMRALGEVFHDRAGAPPLMVGSIKTNVGHTEATAGVAGVIKALLALSHATVPPHLNLRQPNPMIAWDTLPVTVPTKATPWPAPAGAPRRAGVSSFGFSGTNAHVVLEEARPQARAEEADDGRAQLLALSAEGSQALRALAGLHGESFARESGPSLRAVARSVAVGRAALPARAAFVATSRAEAAQRLKAFAAGDTVAGVASGTASGGHAPELVFMFTGQGAQHTGMGMGLYATQPAYRAALDECARILAPLIEPPLLELLQGHGDPRALDDTRYTQPALFAMEYALAQLWRSWGVEPTAVMGHSLGEFVAACVAGVFGLEDALTLVASRARLMARLPRDGGMAAVFADEQRVRASLAGEQRLVVAGCNGRQNTVISGEVHALERALQRFASEGVEAQRLKVSNAFHSPLMDPILDEFEAVARGIRFSPPRITLVSNVTGEVAGEEVCDAAYWRRHLREAVRFGDSLATLAREGFHVFLEVGPQPVLAGMAQRADSGHASAFVASLRKGREDEACMLEALAQLHVRGVPLRPRALWGADAGLHRVELPPYPFQRQRHWLELPPPGASAALAQTRSRHPLLGGAVPSPLNLYQAEIGPGAQPWLAEHRIFDLTPLPATAFLEIALAAGCEALGRDAVIVRDLVLREALLLPAEGTVTMQAIVTPAGGEAHALQVHSREGEGAPWRSHATATLEPDGAEPAQRGGEFPPQAEELPASEYYARLVARGQHYGAAFRGIASIRVAPGEVLGKIVLPDALAPEAARMRVHPALLDACLQLMGVPLARAPASSAAAQDADRYMPVGVERYRVHRPGVTQAWCHVRMADSGDPQVIRADLRLFDDAGATVAELDGVEMRHVSREALARATAASAAKGWCFDVQWVPSPLPHAARDAVKGERWLVLRDAGGVGEALAARLRAEGAEVTCLDAFDAVRAEGIAAAKGIVCLWALDAAAPPDDPRSIDDVLPAALARLLGMARAVSEKATRLWIVTRAAQAAAGTTPDPVQSALWGFAGVIDSEYPALRCTRVDLDAARATGDLELLHAAIRQRDDEHRVALRGGSRWVARLRPHVLAGGPIANRRLEIAGRGSLANLAIADVERQAPGPSEVEIRVHATGLNFRDVMNVLGMYPGDPGALGNECAGVVTAVGAGVNHLAVGDEVVAMTDRSFATWVTAPAAMVARKPARVPFAAAATIPVAFLTADHALNVLGRMGRGTRVLVHAITGGVGMAAAQLARAAGAEVYGTAGTDAKRALALAQGAHWVGDSRSLSFVEEVKAATKGEGIDIVLNSLAGEFIPASLALLRRGGRFIEIGKSDDWDAARVAERFPGIEYTRLYLGEIAAADPVRMRGRLEELLERVASGALSALPCRAYPMERAEEAFRLMAQAQHVGKVVVTQHVAPEIRAEATYLVTGGLGGLGLAAAEWLVAEGARHLVLTGRRAPAAPAQSAIDALRARGATVHVAQADIADEAQLARMLRHVDGTMPPLRGVVHAAGVVDDALLAELDASRFAAVLAPKVRGSWNLHRQTSERPLDFFVLYAAGSGLLGGPGQGNYAAANSFMDGLAHLRAARGLPALSIDWGSWSEVGMAARVSEAHRRRWEAIGLQMIEPARGVEMLGEMLRGARAPQLAAMPIVRSRLPVEAGTFFADLRVAAHARAAAPAAPAVDVRAELAQLDAAKRPDTLQRFLAQQLVGVLGLASGAQVDVRRSVMEMGLDSLMAVELRNRIHGSVGVRVPVTDLLRGPSVVDLASQVLEAMAPGGDGEPARAAEAEWEEGSL